MFVVALFSVLVDGRWRPSVFSSDELFLFRGVEHHLILGIPQKINDISFDSVLQFWEWKLKIYRERVGMGSGLFVGVQ